jgi:hypothetical protein
MQQEAAAMTAIVLPDIDRSTIEELKKRIPDLTEIELSLPSRKEVNRAAKEVGKTAKDVGRTADETIDRLLGRKRAPAWPWIAAGVGLVALAGMVAAWFAWFRRPTWETQPEPWTAEAYEADQSTMISPTEPTFETTRTGGAAGALASEAAIDPVGSAAYPTEEA